MITHFLACINCLKLLVMPMVGLLLLFLIESFGKPPYTYILLYSMSSVKHMSMVRYNVPITIYLLFCVCVSTLNFYTTITSINCWAWQPSLYLTNRLCMHYVSEITACVPMVALYYNHLICRVISLHALTACCFFFCANWGSMAGVLHACQV